eukprot:1751168-Pyramimonas_sp.AAC.1
MAYARYTGYTASCPIRRAADCRLHLFTPMGIDFVSLFHRSHRPGNFHPKYLHNISIILARDSFVGKQCNRRKVHSSSRDDHYQRPEKECVCTSHFCPEFVSSFVNINLRGVPVRSDLELFKTAPPPSNEGVSVQEGMSRGVVELGFLTFGIRGQRGVVCDVVIVQRVIVEV